jgi:sulfite exporter TauE/SafE
MITMLTIGIFLGIVYQPVLEQYLLVFAIVGFSIGIWMLVMWLRKMFSEPHMEQVP